MWIKKNISRRQRRSRHKKKGRAVRYCSIWLWRIIRNGKIREKISSANQWADAHRKETTAITIALLLLCCIGSVTLSLFAPAKENSRMEQIEDVSTTFDGMRQIQANRMVQEQYIRELASKGVNLKKELDSLLALPHKTHRDSMAIYSTYQQLKVMTKYIK